MLIWRGNAGSNNSNLHKALASFAGGQLCAVREDVRFQVSGLDKLSFCNHRTDNGMVDLLYGCGWFALGLKFNEKRLPKKLHAYIWFEIGWFDVTF